MRSRRAILLAAGDATAIVAFAVVGLANHRSGITLDGVVRNAGPILLAWAVLARPLGTYARPGPRTFLATWLAGVTAGVLLRAAWLGHPTGVRLLTFLGVTLGVTLLFIGAWRLLASLSMRALERRGRARAEARYSGRLGGASVDRRPSAG